MLECNECKNWSHAACMDVDQLNVKIARRTFVCLFCTGEAARRLARRLEDGRLAPPPPPKHSVVLKLTECSDTRPPNGKELDASLRQLLTYAASCGFELIFVGRGGGGGGGGGSDPSTALTDSFVEQSLSCCASAIQSATFSETYPSWCLSELRAPPHGYLQGTFMRCLTSKRVVSLVLSNGMDGYGGLRSTVSRLRMLHTKAANKGEAWLPTSSSSSAASPPLEDDTSRSFVESCLAINDVSPFVHINLIATHPNYRGRGLAKMLIAAELLRWALRGRSKAYLNMALDKKLVDNDTRVTCTVSPASKRLYDTFGFRPVLPPPPSRVALIASASAASQSSSSEQQQQQQQQQQGGGCAVNSPEWYSAKEKDSGRVMASLGFVTTVLRVVSSIVSGDSTAHVTQTPAATTAGGTQSHETQLGLSKQLDVEDVVVLPTPLPSPSAKRGRGGGGAKRGRN
jgi:ribosomal protein S18 acetylase RimI-like enzyme